jgi:prepilin-type N-terminal cleavage/methylation domain-containing protein
MKIQKNYSNGFTLIETLVAVFVFALAMGVITGFVVMGYRAQGYTWQQSQAIDEARKGVETMVKEIREARTAENGAYIIDTAEDFQFIFYSDVDKDDEIEKVRYYIEGDPNSDIGAQFMKSTIEPEGFPAIYPPENEIPVVVSNYTRNSPPIFQYYQDDGTELIEMPARKKDTKVMKVFLVININLNRSPQDFELESKVQIRNLKTNL